MRVFFDTSALTKRYVEEEGAERVRALCTGRIPSGQCPPSAELISTLCRLVREGQLSSEDYRSLKSALQHHIVYSLTRFITASDLMSQKIVFEEMTTRYPQDQAEAALQDLLSSRQSS